MFGKLKLSIRSMCCLGNIIFVLGNKIFLLVVGNYICICIWVGYFF